MRACEYLSPQLNLPMSTAQLIGLRVWGRAFRFRLFFTLRKSGEVRAPDY